jgi:hypothetical protein
MKKRMPGSFPLSLLTGLILSGCCCPPPRHAHVTKPQHAKVTTTQAVVTTQPVVTMQTVVTTQPLTPTGRPQLPPPLPQPIEVIGAAPGTTPVWVSAYWVNYDGRWVWLPGHWEDRPRVGAVWIPGHWDQTADGKYVWAAGYWE